MNEVKTHQECKDCGSKGCFTIYDNGGSHCFSCGKTTKGKEGVIVKKETKTTIKKPIKKVRFFEGEYMAMPSRKINLETCNFYDYKISNDKKQHLMSYRNKNGKVICQKTRNANKEFRFIGESKEIQLFGQHTCKQDGGQLIITEGEIDAMSINQTFNNKLNVVSVPMGAQSAVRHVKNNYDFINSYSEIVLAFDQDEPGQEAFESVKGLFAPGKIKKVNFPEGYKDANDLLQAGEIGLLVRVIKTSQLVRPDSIISSMDLMFDDIYRPAEGGIPFKYPLLQEKTMGIRGGELMMLTAGSGIGKSTTAREIAYDFVMNQVKKVGMIFLEEQVQKTATSTCMFRFKCSIKELRQNPNNCR